MAGFEDLAEGARNYDYDFDRSKLRRYGGGKRGG